MHDDKDFNPGDIVDVKIKIPLPPLEEQVGLIASTAMTHPEEAKRTLKLGIVNALTNGTKEDAAVLLQLMWNLFGQSEHNRFVGELIVASVTGDFSKLF
ncbi:MAG: hypothetical protein J6R67_02950 [Treponema sp.]|nr:hypothetical protein [Treponema sp.]